VKRFIGLLFSLVLLAGSAWVLLNPRPIIDFAVASTHKPSSGLVALRDRIQPTERAIFLLNATQAELDDRSSFNHHCQKKAEQTIVLGCYQGPQNIYVYDVQDERFSGVKEVTLAHEMLHAAYERLPGNERRQVNQMLEQALPSLLSENSDLTKRLELYQKIEPGERDNELHSILGTEAAALPPDLENYYKQYFKNRQVVTDYAASYAKVFTNLKVNQDDVVSDLKALGREIDDLSAQYNSGQEQLNSDIDDFNATANNEGRYANQAEFDAARQALVGRRDRLDALRETINQKVSRYNAKRAELQALNVQIEELNNKLDSSSTPSL